MTFSVLGGSETVSVIVTPHMALAGKPLYVGRVWVMYGGDRISRRYSVG